VFTASADLVLAEGSAGDLSSSRSGASLPLGGMLQTVTLAQQRAEAKQAELIGMTPVTESVGVLFASYIVVLTPVFARAETATASFEAETSDQ
jgi:hypothetical protein